MQIHGNGEAVAYVLADRFPKGRVRRAIGQHSKGYDDESIKRSMVQTDALRILLADQRRNALQDLSERSQNFHMSNPHDDANEPQSQLPFPDQPISPKIELLIKPAKIAGLSRKQQWEEFHRINPDVYQKLKAITLDMKRRGIHHWAIEAVYNRLRWLYKFQTHGDDYKLNNNWKSFYSRKLMEDEAELEGFFEVRNQRSREFPK